MGKVLIVASVASMIDQFNRPNIKLLKELGFDVHVACNFIEGSTCSSEKIQQLKTDLQSEGITLSQIDFARNITRISQNLRAYRQIKQLLKQEKYDLVHCHSPIGGLLTRMAAKKYRKKGTRVIYTAHGFHFYKGAPLKNWLLYYPVEWICAHWTDVLITINKEDYTRAKKHMHAGRVEYIPGVGVDTKKFSPERLSAEERAALRESLGVGPNDKMLLSVGELIPRKDHETAIRAMSVLGDKRVKLLICGQGELEKKLQALIDSLGLTAQVKLLGYRTDISSLCDCANLFVFPSRQEGLPVALMEAVASKLPVVCSDIRGNTDFVGEESLFKCGDVDALMEKIRETLDGRYPTAVEENYRRLKNYDLSAVLPQMSVLYERGGVTHLAEAAAIQKLRREMGISPDIFVLLSVGELQSRKNHKVVIDALAELQNPNITYLIAGEGELHEAYQKRIDENGLSDSVRLLGFRSDIAELCGITDCFVHPSVREGLGIAPLEAMACGLPLISADINGIKDYTEDGVTGCCVNPYSVEEMKTAIIKMYTDPSFRETCGRHNIDVVKAFSLEESLRVTEQIYNAGETV